MRSWFFIVTLLAAGCSKPEAQQTVAAGRPIPTDPSPAPQTAPMPVTKVEGSEIGFGRDPFAAPAMAPSPPPPGDTVKRKARKYSLDDLRLVGVVTGGDTRAMLLDPRGKGWMVTRGDHVGRSETVGAGLTGWRVARIRDSEVVFSREDPTLTDRPAETRTLALHTGGAVLESLEMDD
jgi:type IV pilus assembly protein PilP